MTFMKLPLLRKKHGFLDTEEKVQSACASLEKATEDDYRKYDDAQRHAYEEAHAMLLE